jgi:hypothetical protein
MHSTATKGTRTWVVDTELLRATYKENGPISARTTGINYVLIYLPGGSVPT